MDPKVPKVSDRSKLLRYQGRVSIWMGSKVGCQKYAHWLGHLTESSWNGNPSLQVLGRAGLQVQVETLVYLPSKPQPWRPQFNQKSMTTCLVDSRVKVVFMVLSRHKHWLNPWFRTTILQNTRLRIIMLRLGKHLLVLFCLKESSVWLLMG